MQVRKSKQKCKSQQGKINKRPKTTVIKNHRTSWPPHRPLFLRKDSNTDKETDNDDSDNNEGDEAILISDKNPILDLDDDVCVKCRLKFQHDGGLPNNYTCETCETSPICEHCTALVHCQSVNCICKGCFPYNCDDCHLEPLERNNPYPFVSDGSWVSLPICRSCLAIRKRESSDTW
jgi:hypothetical protein